MSYSQQTADRRGPWPFGHHLPERFGRHQLLSVWALSTVLVFFLCAAWSLVTPVGAANDEAAQLIKAASVVRGQLVGPTPSGASAALAARAAENQCYESVSRTCLQAVTVVTVPESFAHLKFPSCFAYPMQPAGCEHGLIGSGSETTATTYVGRYPPLYYAIVGLPSLVWHTNLAVYLMRLLSGLLSALFLGLALALATLWSGSRLLLLAIGIIITPTVIFYGSMVNPSGLEIAASICVWTGGLILVLDVANDPPLGLIMATAAGAVVMVLTRGLSPFWLIFIAATLVALAPGSVATLSKRKNMRIAAGVVTVAGAVAVAYIVWAHTLSLSPIGQAVPAGTSLWGVIELALGRTSLFLPQFIGTFDGVAIGPPLAVTMLWVLAASVVVVLGLVASRRRQAAIIVALIVASLVLPTALMASQAHSDGLVWQARDGFPLYGGILLVAGAVAGRNWVQSMADSAMSTTFPAAQRRLVLLLASVVGAVQLGDFVWALRRYSVGLGSVLNPFARIPGGWSPPVPSVVLVVAMTIATVLYCWWIVRLDDNSLRSAAVAGDGSIETVEDFASL